RRIQIQSRTTFLRIAIPLQLFGEHDLFRNRYPPGIKCGAGFFGIMLYPVIAYPFAFGAAILNLRPTNSIFQMTDVRPLFWILLFALAVLAVFVLQQNGGAWIEFIGLGTASTEAKITALAVAGLLVLALSRLRLSQALRSLL